MLNVIIPVYNAEKTIKRTLSSLMSQTSKKFIVTIIDDCSTDESISIIESFKQFLPIRIISLPENKGVGNARQVGLDTNECDLICFLDSDDMFMPYTVEVYLREMAADFPEVLYTDFISQQKGREVLLVGKERITWFHGKCYRKDFLDKYDIRIPEVRYNEDSGFSTIVHELSEKKAYVPEITYFWSENPNSITRSNGDFNDNSMPNFVKSIHYAFSHINKYKDIQSVKVFYLQLNNIYHYYMSALYNEKVFISEFKEAIQNLFKEFWIENKIRPEMIVEGFSHDTPLKGEKYINTMGHAEWLSEMAQISYTVQDFRVDK